MRETERELQLPPPETRRCTIRIKAAVLDAHRNGAVSLEKASERYALSFEDLRTWERDFERYGVYGLRATRLQIYRDVRSNPRLRGAVKKQSAGTPVVNSDRLKQLEEENAKLKQRVAD